MTGSSPQQIEEHEELLATTAIAHWKLLRGQTKAQELSLSISIYAAATLAPFLAAGLFPSIGFIAEAVGRESTETAVLLLTVPPLFFAIMGPVWGWIADAYGRRVVLLASLTSSGIGAVVCLFAGSSLTWLTIGRVITGGAASGGMVAATALVGDYFPSRDQRARILSRQYFVFMISALFGVLLSGQLGEWNWRAPFALFLYPLLLVPIAWVGVRDAPSVSATRAVIKRASPPSPSLSSKDGGGWLNHEISISDWVSEHPKVESISHETGESVDSADTSGWLWKIPLIYVKGGAVMSVIFFFPVYLPQLLTELEPEMSEWEKSLVFAVWLGAAAIMSRGYQPVLKLMRSTFGVWVWVYGFMALGNIVMATASTRWGLALGSLLIGTGWGCAQPNFSNWTMALAPLRVRGRAVSGLHSALFFGQYASGLYGPLLEEAFGFQGIFFCGFVYTVILGGGWLFVALFKCLRASPAASEPTIVDEAVATVKDDAKYDNDDNDAVVEK